MPPTVDASILAKRAGIAFEEADAPPAVDPKLQALVGDANMNPASTFQQLSPEAGHRLLANPLSPLNGDEDFYYGLIPGAVFQSHDGQVWIVDSYDWEGSIGITNQWYPRQSAVVSIQDLRRAIYSWNEPYLITIPPPPEGVDYGVIRTKSVE